MREQRPILDRQANAAADSAQAAKDTAEAAKGQTGAILKQANALIRSANATLAATGAQLSAAQAQAQAAQVLRDTSVPVVRFGGLQMEGIQSPVNKEGNVDFTIRPFFVNVGNVAIVPGASRVSILFAQSLPLRPPHQGVVAFGGNDIAIPPSGAFAAAKAQSLYVDLAKRNALIKRELNIFVWGETTFKGPRGGSDYRACFLAEVYPDDDTWTRFSQIALQNPNYGCGPQPPTQ